MKIDSFEFDVFLSHSSADKPLVAELAHWLKRDGLRVWYDEWEIRPGASIPQAIERGLERSRVLVFFMSKNSFGSDWSQLELTTFQFRDPLNRERRFIPVLLDDCTIAGSLKQFLYIDWREPRGDDAYRRLFTACVPPSQPDLSNSVGAKRQGPGKASDHRALLHILKCTFTADSNFAFFAGHGVDVRVWDVAKARITQQTFRELGGQVCALALSGRSLFTAGGDRWIRMWDPESGRCLTELGGTGKRIRCLAANGTYLSGGGDDNRLRLWNLESKKQLALMHGHDDSVSALSMTKDHILSGSLDRTLRLWDLSGRCIRVLEGHTGEIHSANIGPNERLALSGSADNTIRLWDLSTGFANKVFMGHTSDVLCTAWHSNGRMFLSGSADRTIRLWDIESGKCVRVLDGHMADVLSVVWRGEQDAVSADSLGFRTWQLPAEDVHPPSPELISQVASQSSDQVQYTNAKVLLVGESSAGKTALSHRLATDTWVKTDSTLGGWATQWKLPMEQTNNTHKEIWLWDFGGQADQRIIHQLYMDETAVTVLVFDGQKQDAFSVLGQWDRDVTRASAHGFAKLLVAGRIDVGGLRISEKQLEQFMVERGFKGLWKTSAKTGKGCNELRAAIIDAIDWDHIPWRSTPTLFKQLKDAIVELKESGQVLMRFNELRDRLKIQLPDTAAKFDDEQLRAVISLLAGPGIVAELKFGGWVLFQPELVNAYAQAVLLTIREDPSEMGCVAEDRVLEGNLSFSQPIEIGKDDQRFILLAMHQLLVERGLCLRQPTAKGNLLVFPSFYRRQRPVLEGHPAVVVSYEFDGFLDEVYSTLIVNLHHTHHYKEDQLWQDAADFLTMEGKHIGVKLSSLGEGRGRIQVYCDASVGIGQKVQFIGYVHAHLNQRAKNVARYRHYTCPKCLDSLQDFGAIAKRLARGEKDIGCPNCDKRIPLADELEMLYASPRTAATVQQLEDHVDIVLDNESKERALVGEVMSAVALAGQICREKSVSDYGIDMEIEFKNSDGHASGELMFLQLKSGDSYLRTRVDGKEVFSIKNPRHASYWTAQKVPVLLVIRNSAGLIRWMEIRNYLSKQFGAGKKPNQIIFDGEPFNTASILKWRKSLLKPAPLWHS